VLVDYENRKVRGIPADFEPDDFWEGLTMIARQWDRALRGGLRL